MIIKTADTFPLGAREVRVFPKGGISKVESASGLRYLKVKAVNGCPFTSSEGGYGRSIFRGDMEFFAEKELFVTPKIEAEYNKYLKEREAEKLALAEKEIAPFKGRSYNANTDWINDIRYK